MAAKNTIVKAAYELKSLHVCEKSSKSRFVIPRFCSIHFIVILAGLQKIVCYTWDFVM